MSDPFCQIRNDKLIYNFHRGQTKAWDSEKRFTFVIAGSQSGKSVFGPPWLNREIERCGEGDYLVVSPSYPLQELKVLPEYKKLFEVQLRCGEYFASKRIFVGRKKGFDFNIFFGTADRPESLESCTAKAAHLDEVGQKTFRLSSWEAVLRRVAIHKGRILGTTTPYNLGWLKTEVYDRWKAGDKDFEVIQFKSTMNPAYPEAEFERARRTLPGWKFKMFYLGQFDKPAGMIYDCFNEEKCKIPRFNLNPLWPRHVGIDFGGVNTAAVWFAEEKINKEITNYYLYREYLAGGRSAKEHAEMFRKLSEGENIVSWVGGAKSEGQWRLEFQQAGIPIKAPPINDVEVGIDRVYGLHKNDRIYVFDDCNGYLDEKMTYSRVLDDLGQPTEKIDDKNSFHRLDAERYVIANLVDFSDWSNLFSIVERSGS